jgi:hypothetical protein
VQRIVQVLEERRIERQNHRAVSQFGLCVSRVVSCVLSKRQRARAQGVVDWRHSPPSNPHSPAALARVPFSFTN